jgi:formiminotetrahydrofolate cyclodeaminase
VKSFSEMEIQTYLKQLASTEPAPGGGSAAAVVVALGAALLGKVASISQTKSKEISFQEEIEKAEKFKQLALESSDLDAKVYGEVIKAYQMKASTDEEKKARRGKIDQELKAAFEVPYQLLKTIKEAEALRTDLLKKSSGAIASDLDVAGTFFEGAAKSALHLAEGNLNYIKDPAIQTELKEKLGAI